MALRQLGPDPGAAVSTRWKVRARGADLSIDTILEITLSPPEIAGDGGGEMIVNSWLRAEGRH